MVISGGGGGGLFEELGRELVKQRETIVNQINKYSVYIKYTIQFFQHNPEGKDIIMILKYITQAHQVTD